jgi:TolB-like protein
MPTRLSRSREIAVLEAVDRITRSGALGTGGRLPALLAFLVREELSGQGQRLKGYVVATEALGRPADFDPQDDGIARAEMTRLRKALDAYRAGPGRFDAVHVTIPKGTYRPVFSDNPAMPHQPEAASPLAALPAPAPTASSKAARPWLLSALLGAAVIAAAGLALMWSSANPRLPADAAPVVIVAPVQIAGSDAELAALGPGLQSDVAARLARQSPLRVVVGEAPRTARESPARETGEANRYRLDITVVAAAEQLTANALLSRWPDREVIWSRSFGPARIAAVTPELIARLSEAIASDVGLPRGAVSRAEITARDLSDSDSAEARFRCVLTARTYWRSYDPALRARALDCATRLAPLDADASAILALLSIEQARRGLPSQRAAALANAERHGERAGAAGVLPLTAALALAACRSAPTAVRGAADALLAAAGNDADVLADVGSKLGVAAGDWTRALALEAQATALNPAADPWYPLATIVRHLMTGRLDLVRAELGDTPQRGFVTGALLMAALAGASQDAALASRARAALTAAGMPDRAGAEALLDGQCWSADIKAALRPMVVAAFGLSG